jgi:hypothetical protein
MQTRISRGTSPLHLDERTRNDVKLWSAVISSTLLIHIKAYLRYISSMENNSLNFFLIFKQFYILAKQPTKLYFMRITQSLIQTLFFLCILSASVAAQAQPRLSGGVRLGYEIVNQMPAYGISAEYGVNRFLSARLSFIRFGSSVTDGETALYPLSSTVHYTPTTYKATLNASTIEAAARIFLGRNREVAAKGFYFAAGLGVIFGKTTYTIPAYDQSLYHSDLNGKEKSYADPLIMLGLGGEFKIAKHVYLGPELMIYLPVTEVDDTQVEVNFGVGLLPSITARYTLFDDEPRRRKGSRSSSSSRSNNSRKSSSPRRR